MVRRHCSFKRIRHLWVQLVSCFTIYKTAPLPDDVIFEILSRLPHKCVAKCRRVCKKWYELTSTIDFAHTHLQRQDSITTEKVLLLQCVDRKKKKPSEYGQYIDGYDNFFILNGKAKGKKILPDLNTTSEVFPYLHGSCNGLLIFKSQDNSGRNYLFNPTTQERINIRCNKGVLCGFFFRPSSKEYILLYISEACIGGTYKYYLFSLESESLRKVCNFPYNPLMRQVFSNGALYWKIACECDCGNSVMEFNVETEVFDSFPHPGKRCGPMCNCSNLEDTRLLEFKGQILLCRTFSENIDMWVLEDHENRIWVKRYSVHLDWDLKLYPFENEEGFESGVKKIHVLSVQNGELLLMWWTKGLFLYNLEKKKVKKVNTSALKVKGKFLGVILESCYVRSLVSLKVSTKYPNTGKFPTFGQVIIDLE